VDIGGQGGCSALDGLSIAARMAGGYGRPGRFWCPGRSVYGRTMHETREVGFAV
jgi:hypothetical protein